MIAIGDRECVDLDVLRKLAPVKEVTLDQLFGFGPFDAESRWRARRALA